MQSEEHSWLESAGKKIGFGAGFFIFISAFYTVLHLTHKIPPSVGYLTVLSIGGIVYLLWLIRSIIHHDTSEIIF